MLLFCWQSRKLEQHTSSEISEEKKTTTKLIDNYCLSSQIVHRKMILAYTELKTVSFLQNCLDIYFTASQKNEPEERTSPKFSWNSLTNACNA